MAEEQDKQSITALVKSQRLSAETTESLELVGQFTESVKQILIEQEFLRRAAKQRRGKKTPKGVRKKRTIGDGKEVDTVDRPEYQRQLDEEYPGWYCEDIKYWETRFKDSRGSEMTLAFNCSLILVVTEKIGTIRRIPGVGAATVSRKEIERDSATLLRFKNTAAKTAAIKDACNWLGFFFDLRVDEEQRDRLSQPPSASQAEQFGRLLVKVPDTVKATIQERWLNQNLGSAATFLENLRKKLEEADSSNRTPTTERVNNAT